uniref:Transposase n=1 Tax=Globodera rostochiensis TaxID=31243 RepID=A0A914HPY3_GLORO
MEKFWILIFVLFFATNSFDKAKSVQLEETPHKIIDEIFGEGWWDKDKADEWDKLTLEQNVHHQIDRQNTQIGQIEPNSTDQLGKIEPNSTDQLGQIEPNSTDQLGQIEPNSTDQLGQIEPNSTDQNSPLTESDHSENAKNGEEQNEITSNENIAENERKQKFDQRKAELKRAGFKNSYHHEIAKELGICVATIYAWKSKLCQTKPQHNHNKQKELMKRYYEIKDKNPEIRDEEIAKMLKIGTRTLLRWKKQFERQQFHPNSVDEENAAANGNLKIAIRRPFE